MYTAILRSKGASSLWLLPLSMAGSYGAAASGQEDLCSVCYFGENPFMICLLFLLGNGQDLLPVNSLPTVEIAEVFSVGTDRITFVNDPLQL